MAGSIAIYRTALVDPTQIDLESVREDQLDGESPDLPDPGLSWLSPSTNGKLSGDYNFYLVRPLQAQAGRGLADLAPG